MSLRDVERFLLNEPDASLSESLVLDHGLVGPALARAASPRDVRLAAAGALVKREHERNRALVRDLVAAWAECGIETLLFKGFALAEFVYPDASWRPYSDVDAAIDPRHLEAAHEAALGCGWRVLWRVGARADAWSHHGDDYYGHELMLLEHPSGLSLDLHRRLLHNNDNRVPRFAHQARITRAVWEAAEPADLDGVEVKLPTREDMALVGLVLNRYWSGDRYELRATDYLDLGWLMGLTQTEGHDVEAESASERTARLEARATELGCRRTLAAFLRRCDPFTGVVALRPCSGPELALLDLELAQEHGHRQVARFPRDVAEAVRLTLGAVREVPTVRRARRELANARDGVIDERDEAGSELTHRLWRSRLEAVRTAIKLLSGGRGSAVDDDLLALALAMSLKRSGVAVTLGARGQSGAVPPADVPSAAPSLVLRSRGRRLPMGD